MCLNREQTERRMLQMSPNVDRIWYIKRMGHLWANVHPPGPAMGTYWCRIDLPYGSGELARKPAVCGRAVPAPHPAPLSRWKHPRAWPPCPASVPRWLSGPNSKKAVPCGNGVRCECVTVTHPPKTPRSRWVPPPLVRPGGLLPAG